MTKSKRREGEAPRRGGSPEKHGLARRMLITAGGCLFGAGLTVAAAAKGEVAKEIVTGTLSTVRGIVDGNTPPAPSPTSTPAPAAAPIPALPRLLPRVEVTDIRVVCTLHSYIEVSFNGQIPEQGWQYWGVATTDDKPLLWYPSAQPERYGREGFRAQVFIDAEPAHRIRIVYVPEYIAESLTQYIEYTKVYAQWWLGFSKPDGAVVLIEENVPTDCPAQFDTIQPMQRTK